MTTYNSYNDHELVDSFKSGDDAAFGELYYRYHDLIYRFVRKYLRSSELSEDICQNVFIKIWEQRASHVHIVEFGAYIFIIAKRQALDYLKHAAVEATAMGIILKNYNPNLSIAEDSQEVRDYMEFIEKILDSLPEQIRAVFKLCRQQYHSYEEAAEILGISHHTVKKRMMRAMKVLKVAAEGELGISFMVLLTLMSTKF